MLQAFERLTQPELSQATLTLTFDQRRHSRLRARLDDGREIALFLPRGSVLRDGDLVKTEDGLVVSVRAAPEVVSTARSTDPQLLTRVAYHLGNRHILLQIGPGWLRYQHDHVLDDMVAGMKVSVRISKDPFEPETGPYHTTSPTPHAHPHGHDHDHAHHHDHGHAHPHDHGHDHGHDHDHAPAPARRGEDPPP